eukprot:jgi/Mesen1/2137/ME000152S01229
MPEEDSTSTVPSTSESGAEGPTTSSSVLTSVPKPATPGVFTRWKRRGSAKTARDNGMGRILSELQAGQRLRGTCVSSAVLVEATPVQHELLEKGCYGKLIPGDSNVMQSQDEAEGSSSGEQVRVTQLTLEEAFYLAHAAPCLTLLQPSEQVGPRALSRAVFVPSVRGVHVPRMRTGGMAAFPELYAAYWQLREKRWVVRSGVQYGADFMAYKHHPAFVHADYAVLVMREDDQSRVATWINVHASARLCGTVAKTLLLLYVSCNEGVDATSVEYLKHVRVEEVEVRRWLPEKHRDKPVPGGGQAQQAR